MGPLTPSWSRCRREHSSLIRAGQGAHSVRGQHSAKQSRNRSGESEQKRPGFQGPQVLSDHKPRRFQSREMSVRRVPPPPPPGFGDEEYYRLYGRPEEYHRYRARLERKMRIEGPSGDDRDGRYRHRPRSDRHSPPEPGEEIDVNRHR